MKKTVSAHFIKLTGHKKFRASLKILGTDVTKRRIPPSMGGVLFKMVAVLLCFRLGLTAAVGKGRVV